MYFNFFTRVEPQMVYRDNLHKINVWVMRALLLVAFIFANFFETNSSIVQSAISSELFYYMKPEFIYPIVHLFSGALNVLFFEIIANAYYSFIRPICPPVNLSRKGFMVYLRATFFAVSLVTGVIRLVFLFGDIYYFIFNVLIDIVVTTVGVLVAFWYINKHYVPENVKGNFAKLALMPYLVVQIISVCAGILL